MKLSRTAIKELTAAYRAVLKHGFLCNAIALGLIAAVPAHADPVQVSDWVSLRDGLMDSGTSAMELTGNITAGAFDSGVEVYDGFYVMGGKTVNFNGFTLDGNNVNRQISIRDDNTVTLTGGGTVSNLNYTTGNNQDSQAGSIFVAVRSTLALEDGDYTFSDNQSRFGVINVNNNHADGTTSFITNNVGTLTFDGNTSTDQGGALYTTGTDGKPTHISLNADKIVFNDNSVTNETKTGHGGAIMNMSQDATLSANTIEFTYNKVLADTGELLTDVVKSGGGAIQNAYSGDLTIGKAGGTVLFGHNSSTTNGGALLNRGDSKTKFLGSVEFDNNHADINGGAIYNTSSQAQTLSDATLTNNSAGGQGGAIWNSGILNLNGTRTAGENPGEYTYSFNVTDNSATGNGGAIYNDNAASLINITGTKFSGNHTDSNGGGAMFVFRGTADINQSEFANNSADYGGAIYTKAGGTSDLTITNSRFVDNTASEVGAVGILRQGVITNTDFIGNTATNTNMNALNEGGSGAIFLGSESYTTITGGTFENNTSGTRGGAIGTRRFIDGLNTAAKLDINGTTFTGNSATVNGGAIDNFLYNDAAGDGYVKVTNATFTENSAANGGAIYNHKDASQTGNMYFADSTFTGNNVTANGGAIYNEGTMTLSGVTFEDGIANGTYTPNAGGTAATYANGKGGAIYNTGTLTVGGTFENNTGFHGGAIYNTGSLTVSEGSTFDSNYANVEGGAIANTGTLTIGNDVTFSNNTAAIKAGDLDVASGGSNMGAAIYSEGSSSSTKTVEIGNDVKFTDNTSDGGALYFYGANNVTIGNNIEFSGNTGVNAAALRAANNGSNGYASITIGDNALFNNNEGVYASAMMIGSGSSINVGQNAVFSDNTGTAIRNNGTLTFGANATFSGNESTSTNEAGALRNTGVATFDSASFVNNRTNAQGGAINNKSGATLNLNANSGNVTFSDNKANGVDNDIYNAGTLNLAAAADRTISLAGGIDGLAGTLNITGVGLVETSTIKNQTVAHNAGELHLTSTAADGSNIAGSTITVADGATINTIDNLINNYMTGTSGGVITLANGANIMGDIDFTAGTADTYASTGAEYVNYRVGNLIGSVTSGSKNIQVASNGTTVNREGFAWFSSDSGLSLMSSGSADGMITVTGSTGGIAEAADASGTVSEVDYNLTANETLATNKTLQNNFTLTGDGTEDGDKGLTLNADLGTTAGADVEINDLKLAGTGSLNNASGATMRINDSLVDVDVNNEGTLISDPTTYSATVTNIGLASFDADTFTGTAILANSGTVNLSNGVTFESGAEITNNTGITNLVGGYTHFNNTANENTINVVSGANFDGTVIGGTINTQNGMIDAIVGSIQNANVALDVDTTAGATDTFASVTDSIIKSLNVSGAYGTANTVDVTVDSGLTLDSNATINGGYYTNVAQSGTTLTFSDKLINESGLYSRLGASWTGGTYIKSAANYTNAADSTHLTVGQALSALDTAIGDMTGFGSQHYAKNTTNVAANLAALDTAVYGKQNTIVDSSTIAANGADGFDVVAGSIGTTHLSDGAVTSAKIADGTIVNADIAAGTITTDRLANQNVSQFTNDAGYQNATQVGNAITTALANGGDAYQTASQVDTSITNALANSGNAYQTASDVTTTLSAYSTTTQMNTAITNALANSGNAYQTATDVNTAITTALANGGDAYQTASQVTATVGSAITTALANGGDAYQTASQVSSTVNSAITTALNDGGAVSNAITTATTMADDGNAGTTLYNNFAEGVSATTAIAALDTAVGDRQYVTDGSYTGSLLSDGQTVASSILAIANQTDVNTTKIGTTANGTHVANANSIGANLNALDVALVTTEGIVSSHTATIAAHTATIGTTADGTHVANANSIGANLNSLDTALAAAEADIATLTAGENVAGSVRNIAKAYIEANVQNSNAYVDERIEKLDENLSAGVASAVALSSVAVSDVRRGEVSVGAGYGYFNGQSAGAFGAAMGISNRWSVNAGAGISGYDVSFRAGTNYKFKLF